MEDGIEGRVVGDDAYMDRWRTIDQGEGGGGLAVAVALLFTTRDTRGYSPFSFLFSKSSFSHFQIALCSLSLSSGHVDEQGRT